MNLHAMTDVLFADTFSDLLCDDEWDADPLSLSKDETLAASKEDLGLSSIDFAELASEIKPEPTCRERTPEASPQPRAQPSSSRHLGPAAALGAAARAGGISSFSWGSSHHAIPAAPILPPLGDYDLLTGDADADLHALAKSAVVHQVAELYRHTLRKLPPAVQRRTQQHMVLRTAAVRRAGVPIDQAAMLVQQELLPLMRKALLVLQNGGGFSNTHMFNDTRVTDYMPQIQSQTVRMPSCNTAAAGGGVPPKVMVPQGNMGLMEAYPGLYTPSLACRNTGLDSSMVHSQQIRKHKRARSEEAGGYFDDLNMVSSTCRENNGFASPKTIFSAPGSLEPDVASPSGNGTDSDVDVIGDGIASWSSILAIPASSLNGEPCVRDVSTARKQQVHSPCGLYF